MKILVVGGGSAGHITPLVAVLKELRTRKGNDLQLHLVRQRSDAVFDELYDDLNLKKYTIYSGKIRRYAHWTWWKYFTHIRFMILNVRDVFLLFMGFIQSIRLLRRLHPDLVFSKGGFVGLPVGLAAGLLKIPLVTHDSDARIGLSNRLLRRWTTIRAIGMPSDHDEPHTVYTGTPVRGIFFGRSKSAARKKLNIKVSQKLIIISGGSLGAQKINDALLANLFFLNNRGYQIIHLGGAGEYKRLKRITDGLKLQYPDKYQLLPFVGDGLADLYAAADVVVSRAGATSIAELASLKKAVVFIPNSYLGDQIANGQLLEECKAAYVLDEKVMMADASSLAVAIEFLLADRDRRANYSKELGKFFKSESSAQITAILEEVATNAATD